MKQVIRFRSLKSSGATQMALQLAVYHAWKHPDQKVALCQIHDVPDIAILTGDIHPRTWYDWAQFHETDEWDTIAPSIPNTYHGVQVFSSPGLDALQDISSEAWSAMAQNVLDTFDVVYLDVPDHLFTSYGNYWESSITQSVLCTTLHPAAMANVGPMITPTDRLLVNQVPHGKQGMVDRVFSLQKDQIIGVISSDLRSFWDQTYEYFPVLFQRKSPCKSQIQSVWEKLFFTSSV